MMFECVGCGRCIWTHESRSLTPNLSAVLQVEHRGWKITYIKDGVEVRCPSCKERKP